MKLPALVCAAFCLASAAAQAQTNPFLHADHQQIMDGSGKPVLLRGMGLGGWMLQEGYMLNAGGLAQHAIQAKITDMIGPDGAEAFYQTWRDNFITKADVDAMASWGFNSVRLPMHYNLFMEDGPGPIRWKDEGFRRSDDLVRWAKANDMVVILDLHAAPGGQGNDLPIADRDPATPSLWQDTANQDKVVALWRKLAEHFKDEPAIGGYDILNEPNWGFQNAKDLHGCDESGNAPLKALYQRIIAAIREVDTRHMIIIEGNCWGNNYDGLLPMADGNLALSFHKYWNNTDQDSIQKFLDLRTKYDMPLWNGESGENSNDWFAHAIALEEDNGIGWSWWPLKKFGFNNPLQIQPNTGMTEVEAYWQGKGERPARTTAEAALMQLAAHDVRHDSNLFHPDVVDALFRAAHSDQAVPYAAHIAGDGAIPAVEYDMGREGSAYHDTVSADLHVSTGGDFGPWNDGKNTRNDGVDIAPDGRSVLMRAGEWLHYTLSAPAEGDYRLVLAGSGDFTVRFNNGAPQALSAERAATVHLESGRNVVVVAAASSAPVLSDLSLTR